MAQEDSTELGRAATGWYSGTHLPGEVPVDLQRFRDSLTPAQRAAMDVDVQWRRYRAQGGFEDEAAFETWLAGQFPQLFAARGGDEFVEVSRVLPARFAHADARTLDIADAATIHVVRDASSTDT